jgi:hypothetical protein
MALEMNSRKEQAPRAPLIREKLEAAEQALAALESEIGPLACDEAEGKPGAAAKLAALNSKIEAAKRTRHQMRNALRFALQDDLKTAAAGAAKMRDEQFAVCQAAGARRLIAAQTIFNALAAAVPAMSEYAIQTNEMVTALPTGTNVGILSMGNNGWAGSWIGNLANLISAEAYRLAIPDKEGRGARLPFAKAPDIRSDDPAKIEPAMDLLRAAQAKAISEIQLQLEKLNREALAMISKTEVLKEKAA